MGFGVQWSAGHGGELAILAEALNKADPAEIKRLRDDLEGNHPIMDALDVVLKKVDLKRTSNSSQPLPPWDPAVTQFRWYDPQARFWTHTTSSPFQIDRDRKSVV